MELQPWMSECALFLANVATAFGVPIAIIAFLIDRCRDRRSNELATYTELNGQYLEHLRLLLDHPNLSAVDCAPVSQGLDHRERDQHIVMHTAVGMLEAAYFLYRDHRTPFKKVQWEGWNDYMRDWCREPEFRNRWPAIVDQFDSGFRDHIRSLYECELRKEVERSTATAR